MSRSLISACVFGGLLALVPDPAYAYIDPGLGSLLFQSAVAAFIAAGAAWVGFKMKIQQLFDRLKGKKSSESKS